MRGFILGAGFGTRLKPITEHLPKALVPLGAEPVLGRNLRYLWSQGFETIGVNSHFFHAQMEQFASKFDVPFTLFHESGAIRGTGGALQFAREFLGQEDTFFVLNVDVVSNFNIRQMGECFKKSSDICSLVAVPVDKGGTIAYNSESMQFMEVASKKSALPGAATADFTGCAFYRREFLELLSDDDFSILPLWEKAKQMSLGVGVLFPENRYWIDIGKPGSYAQIYFDYLDKNVEFGISSDMICDFEHKICYNRNVSSDVKDNLGPYSWVESAHLPPGVSIQKSIVWRNANSVSELISEKIVTPWGDVPFQTAAG